MPSTTLFTPYGPGCGVSWMTLVDLKQSFTTGRPAFTCASCHAIFESGDAQRTHYQSDWHRYNLRRKVSELPPVTEAIFGQRLYAFLNPDEKAPKPEGLKMECQACRKSFASENSYANHLKSKKHLENETVGLGEPKLVIKPKAKANPELNKDSYLDQDATEEQIREALESKLSMARRLKPEECIFCNHSFESFNDNMEHMVKDHGLYVPDLEFVEDLPGMISYLADKVSVAFCCLYCNASVQPFTSIESVRRHMLDKGHLKIRFDDEGMQELADFYNYEEILSDDGDDEFVDVDDEGEFESALVISPDETELILPSGKRLGNRAYRKYYKQNLPVERDERPSRRSEHQALISRMSDHYLAAGMMQPAAERKYIIDQRRDGERRKEWDQKVSVRANRLQEYFRIQLRQ
ncbi:hypothetical protein PSACC_02529 [Paramicrosporidium saccamoebae]|uniref:C2H2-type domain-containing protein n=1 Tax=Paramicrosporidium saccamoebae TaxID=1246581 RepID=A0A2H9TIT2_9FUNG|nr:hypothetical protein PSACC_02529 [Paramicrosporidium saccamoebae]